MDLTLDNLQSLICYKTQTTFAFWYSFFLIEISKHSLCLAEILFIIFWENCFEFPYT